MSLCPEFSHRQSLSDEEFWAHIFQTDYFEFDIVEEYYLPMPCPVCGSVEECGYDIEGRPMIHTFGDIE